MLHVCTHSLDALLQKNIISVAGHVPEPGCHGLHPFCTQSNSLAYLLQPVSISSCVSTVVLFLDVELSHRCCTQTVGDYG